MISAAAPHFVAGQGSIATLQQQLQQARAAKAAADAKLAEVNKQSMANRAERDKTNAELKDVKAKMAEVDKTIVAAKAELKSGAGDKADRLQEIVNYDKIHQQKISESMPGVSFKDANAEATITAKVNDPNFKEFKSPAIAALQQQLDASSSGQERIDLRKQIDAAVEQERQNVRTHLDEMARDRKDLQEADPAGKFEGTARRLQDAQDAKEELLKRFVAATDKLLTSDNYKDRRNAAAQVAAADDALQKLQKQLSDAQAAAAPTAKPQPTPVKVAKATPTPAPSVPSTTKTDTGTASSSPADAGANTVTVPDLSAFDNVSEMKAVLAHAGLVGAFNASGKPSSKDQEFKFAGQSPGANSKVAPGSTVTISIYQKFDDGSATASSDDAVVPDLSVFDNVSEMKAVLAHAGLVGAFAAGGPAPSKDKEFKFASQSPGADSKLKRGSTVNVTIFQAVDSGTSGDTVPSVTGLTLEQASAKLSSAGLNVAGIENSAKTDQKEKVNTIYEQSPAAGSKLPDDKSVRIKLYGSLLTKGPQPSPNQLDEMIPGADKDLIGEFSGTAEATEYEFYDTKHEHPKKVTKPITIGITHDANAGWQFSARLGQNSGLGGIGTTTVSGGVLTWHHKQTGVEWNTTIKVQGNQLVGNYQAILTGTNIQPDPIPFTATRTK